jgi:5-formyltetrahydrofolate cyclo-ligase
MSPAPSAAHVLRQRLLAQRRVFVQSPAFAEAACALSLHLQVVLQKVEPQCLGVYWALAGEFDATATCLRAPFMSSVPLALPFATQACKTAAASMHYRAWDRQAPKILDDCRIPTGSGPAVQPDVVLVPCVGFTASGYRLGYGGGYFDRYLAAHPSVTAIGLAWADFELGPADWQPQTHDVALTWVITQNGVVGDAASPKNIKG